MYLWCILNSKQKFYYKCEYLKGISSRALVDRIIHKNINGLPLIYRPMLLSIQQRKNAFCGSVVHEIWFTVASGKEGTLVVQPSTLSM